MTALELFLCACVIVMIAHGAWLFARTRKAIAERERYRKELAWLKELDELREHQSRCDPPRRKNLPHNNRGTSAGTSRGGVAGQSAAPADLSQPLTTILYDTSPSYSAPERCESSSFSDSISSSSSDGGAE